MTKSKIISILILAIMLVIAITLVPGQADAPASIAVETIVSDLQFGTAIAVDHAHNIYVADTWLKQIKVYDPDGMSIEDIPIPPPANGAIGTIIGLALDPDFAQTPVLYVHYIDRIRWANVIVRFRHQAGEVSDARIILDIPIPDADPDSPHNGGHLAVAPDGALIVGMGDHGREFLVDDLDKPEGKILRIDRQTGEGLPDNPYFDGPGPNDDRIWALGVRNPFGVGIDSLSGDVWSSDNGPACGDEINRIVPAGHFGWPHSSPSYFECEDPGPAYEPPAWYWQKTIAPTGLTVYRGPYPTPWEGTLLACDWKTGSLRRFPLSSDGKTLLAEEVIDIGPAQCKLDIAVDGRGYIYLLDTMSVHRIPLRMHWLPMMRLS